MHVPACTMNTYCCGDHLKILVTAATVEWTAELRPCGLDPFALRINSSSSSLLFLMSVSFWEGFRKLLIICSRIWQQSVKIKQLNASLKQKKIWCTLQPFGFIYFVPNASFPVIFPNPIIISVSLFKIQQMLDLLRNIFFNYFLKYQIYANT